VQALTRDEVRRLLQAARAHRERDWLMILVAFLHGLRASEVTGITPDAVKDGYLTVQRLKGSRKTTQTLIANEDPLFNERDALVDLVRKSKPGRTLFGVGRRHFWRIVQRHARTAGIPKHKAHPHALKHSIAMETIRSAGIQNVQRYLGHKSLASTGAYLQVSDEAAGTAIAKALRTRSRV